VHEYAFIVEVELGEQGLQHFNSRCSRLRKRKQWNGEERVKSGEIEKDIQKFLLVVCIEDESDCPKDMVVLEQLLRLRCLYYHLVVTTM